MIRKTKALSAILATNLAMATPLTAQGISTLTVPAPDSTNQQVRLVTPTDALALLGTTAAVLALIPNDRSIATAFQRNAVQSSGALKGAANVFDAAADPGVIVFSAATYFLGLGIHSRSVASLGMHTGEAIVMSGVITQIMKGAFGRARPSLDINNPRDFRSGRGFSNDDYGSFPSGEVTIAFATAAAASREVALSWPNASRYVTPASYAAATMVGLARVYKNQHWASDVVAGATVGTMSGILFERYNQKYPSNVFNRIFLPRAIEKDRDRTLLVWAVGSSE